MLTTITKKLCPLMSLALAFGCGKKINDPKTTEANRSTQNQELPAVLTLQVKEIESTMKKYELPRNAWFSLPTKLLVRQGNGIGKRVKIFYNQLADSSYEFHCFYKSTAKPAELDFEKCESNLGVEIISSTEDLENMDFPMDKGSAVKMQLLNPTGTNLIIDSTYIVDWK